MPYQDTDYSYIFNAKRIIFTSFLFMSEQQITQAALSPYNIENRPKQNQLLGALEPVPTLQGEFANTVTPEYANYFQGESFVPHKWDLKKDQNEQGFASGIDDLGRILLDNKSDIKFNKRLITNQGARYWVNQKNAKIPNTAKHWAAYTTDINKDGVPEVVIADGNGNIRYINGWHLSKTKHGLQKVHQKYIEDHFGNPSQIADLRRQGKIKPGQLSLQEFIYNNTAVVPDYPDGPLAISDILAPSGYKTRAANPCNIFMRHVTKPLYDKVFPNYATGLTEDQIKWLKKEASIIKLNAKLYTQMIANPCYDELQKAGLSDRQMKKSSKGKPSPFSQRCVDEIQRTMQNPGSITYIEDLMGKFIAAVKGQMPANYTIPREKPTYPDKRRRYGGQFNPQSWINAPEMQVFTTH